MKSPSWMQAGASTGFAIRQPIAKYTLAKSRGFLNLQERSKGQGVYVGIGAGVFFGAFTSDFTTGKV